MIYEKKDKTAILRWDMDENTRLPNGKLYNFIALSPTAESITLLDGITEIGYGAFAVYQKSEDEFEFFTPSIQEIYIPSSVRYVENGAFAFLNLEKLHIAPDCKGLKQEGKAVLSGDGKRMLYFIDTDFTIDYTLPNGVEEIGDEAFSICVMNVALPNSVKVIRANAFSGFEGKVMIPKSVEKIEEDAFDKKKWFKKSKTVLFVEKGSYAHKWAKKNRVKYKIMQ